MKTPEKALKDWMIGETQFGGDRWVYPLNRLHVIELLDAINNGIDGYITNYLGDDRHMLLELMFGKTALSALLRGWENRLPITPQLFFQFENMDDLGEHLGVDLKALRKELETIPRGNTYLPKRK